MIREGIKMKIHIAHLETSNFEFAGYGHHNVEAEVALKRAFVKHIDDHDGSLTWNEVKADVWFEVVELGAGSVR